MAVLTSAWTDLVRRTVESAHLAGWNKFHVKEFLSPPPLPAPLLSEGSPNMMHLRPHVDSQFPCGADAGLGVGVQGAAWLPLPARPPPRHVMDLGGGSRGLVASCGRGGAGHPRWHFKLTAAF